MPVHEELVAEEARSEEQLSVPEWPPRQVSRMGQLWEWEEQVPCLKASVVAVGKAKEVVRLSA